MSKEASKPPVPPVGATSTSRIQPFAHTQDLRKGRTSQLGCAYLITTCTHDRQPIFLDLAAGEIILTSIRHLHDAGRVESIACVVIPDHLHGLFTLRSGTLPSLMQSLKNYTSKQLAVRG